MKNKCKICGSSTKWHYIHRKAGEIEERGAEIVKKVLVKNVVASGIQDKKIVGVARQMKILE